MTDEMRSAGELAHGEAKGAMRRYAERLETEGSNPHNLLASAYLCMDDESVGLRAEIARLREERGWIKANQEDRLAKRNEIDSLRARVAELEEALLGVVGWTALAKLLDKGLAASIDGDPCWIQARAALAAKDDE